MVMLEDIGEDNEEDMVRDQMFSTIGSRSYVSSTFTIPRQIPSTPASATPVGLSGSVMSSTTTVPPNKEWNE